MGRRFESCRAHQVCPHHPLNKYLSFRTASAERNLLFAGTTSVPEERPNPCGADIPVRELAATEPLRA